MQVSVFILLFLSKFIVQNICSGPVLDLSQNTQCLEVLILIAAKVGTGGRHGPSHMEPGIVVVPGL